MKSIRVTNEFYGVHHWPEAPDEVAHLRNLHAHIFKVEAEIEVDHGNRFVEFFTAKKHLGATCRTMTQVLERLPDLSCEDMAEKIAGFLLLHWKYNIIKVVVSEPEIGDGVYYADDAFHRAYQAMKDKP